MRIIVPLVIARSTETTPQRKLLAAGAILWCLAGVGCQSHLDQRLLRESADDGKAAAPRYQDYIFDEVAKAQAMHGYYADALGTARLVREFPDQTFIKLVEIRAQQGDIAGAKAWAAASAPDVALRAWDVVAVAQANAGDLAGARATGGHLQDKSDVLEAIADYQFGSGDLDGALATTEELQDGRGDYLLWGIATEMRKRGDPKWSGVARRISDKGIRRSVDQPALHGKATSSSSGMPCYDAVDEAKAGHYAAAHATLRAQHGCDCETRAYVSAYAHDMQSAEREFRTCPNPSDVSFGMAYLATQSADLGNIADALHFAAATQVVGAYDPLGYRAPVLRDIADAWCKKGGLGEPIAWARSTPAAYERAMALLGVADYLMPSARK